MTISVMWPDVLSTIRGGAARVRAAVIATLALAIAAPAVAKPVSVYAVIDAQTGDLLHGSRIDQRVHPASLTKMMTLYLVFEAIDQGKLSFETQLKTSRAAAAEPPSKLGLKIGERISVRDALRATAISSANDASVVLAEAVSGTEAAFARAMTDKAATLGMKNTRFRNPHGLTQSGHLSTARDMSVLARALWRDFPRHYSLFSRKRVSIRGRSKRATNTLLGVAPGVDGIKTGYTRAAGHNLAASAVRSGRRVIAVYMGGSSRRARDRTVTALLNRGFEALKDRTAPLYAQAPRPRASIGSDSPGIEVASIAEPTPAPTPASARSDRLWAVQVGAFKRERSANDHLSRLISLEAPGLLGGYRTVVAKRMATSLSAGAPAKTVYRARFTGLDERDARSACRYLKKKSMPCALVPPGGWAPGAQG
ncbi:MAG: serine hydrolase [Pseudomonadota bacterium]